MNIKDKIRKLVIMAERGAEDGERDNAGNLVEKLLKKYDMTLDDVLDDGKTKCEFVYKGHFEKRLLFQIIFRVTKSADGITTWQPPRSRSRVEFSLSRCEEIEARTLYEIHKRELKEHFETAFDAYIRKNKIYSGHTTDDSVELDPDEIEQIRKSWQMMKGMKSVTINPMIA